MNGMFSRGHYLATGLVIAVAALLVLDRHDSRVVGPAAQLPSPRPVPSLDPSAPDRQLLQQMNGLADRFGSESSDSAWAPAVAATLREDLSTVAKRGKFEIENVECKATMCVARVTWPDYGVARSRFTSVLHARIRANCTTTIHLDEPSPQLASTRFSALAYYQCQRT